MFTLNRTLSKLYGGNKARSLSLKALIHRHLFKLIIQMTEVFFCVNTG